MFGKYFWNLLISLDQTVNTVLGGNPDETLSGRMGKRIEEGRATKAEVMLCKALSWIDRGSKRHCVESIDRDEYE